MTNQERLRALYTEIIPLEKDLSLIQNKKILYLVQWLKRNNWKRIQKRQRFSALTLTFLSHFQHSTGNKCLTSSKRSVPWLGFNSFQWDKSLAPLFNSTACISFQTQKFHLPKYLLTKWSTINRHSWKSIWSNKMMPPKQLAKFTVKFILGIRRLMTKDYSLLMSISSLMLFIL